MVYRPPTAGASLLSRLLSSAPVEPGNRNRRHRSSRRHFEHGTRRAVRRAFTAAQLYMAGVSPTLAAAAEACGANKRYVAAAITVLRTEDEALNAAVLDGTVSLLPVARAMRQTADLLSAYRAADGVDKYAVSRAISVGTIWDECIVPILDDADGKEVAAI
jgi:hypothetical protein